MTGATVLCRACGASLDATARFCVACGAPVVATAPTGAPLPDVSRGIRTRMLEQLRDATLGEYEILLELGAGGMATVYLAHDLQLDRKVAIKLMHPTLVAGDGMVERFILEARTAAGLSHANIIPIYAVKVQEDLLYFVMKYVEGRALDSIIKAEAPLAADTVRHVVTQVADALGYAHRHGVVHRDIKPANIIISTDGQPILADFGIARVVDKPGLTLTGATIGTPTYMSPEQCGAEVVTGASDQYSLGVTAFEMLTGKPPFDAASHLTLMLKQMSEPAPPVAGKVPDCPRDLASIIDRMLAKEPADRFGAMEEIVERLQAAPVTSMHTVHTQLVSFALADPRREQLKRVSTPRSPIPTTGRRSSVGPPAGTPPANRTRGLVLAGAASVAVVAGGILLRQRTSARPPADSAVAAPIPPPAATPAPAESIVTMAPAGPPPGAPPRPSPAVPAPPRTPAPVVAAAVVAAVRIIGPESLSAGSGGVLQAEVRDASGKTIAGRPVSWISSAPDVVAVSAGGRLQAQGEGRATITATVEGVSQRLEVTVTAEPVSVVSVEPSTVSLATGASVTLAARVASVAGQVLHREVTWSTGAPAVASVTPSGTVTAVGPGRATITAASGGRTGTATVTVTPPAPVSAPAAAPAPAGAGASDAEQRTQIAAMFQAYARALESRDMTRVRQVYPAMTAAREQELRETLATMDNLRIQLYLGPVQGTASSVTAIVTGTWTFTSRGKRGTLPANDRYRLEKRADGWVITGVE